MPRGQPLEDAPGWRVIERPQPRKRRISVTILAIATLLLLAFAATYRYQVGWPADHQPQIASPAISTVARAASPSTKDPIAGTPEPGRTSAALPEPVVRQPDTTGVARSEPEVAATPLVRSPPARADSLRIFIHYPAHHGDAVPAIRLAALLQTRGFPIVDIRLVEREVERPSVRYFFPGDRADSGRLVDVIGTLSPHDAPDKATDFSHFSPKPRPGTVELWLPAAGPGPMAQESPL